MSADSKSLPLPAATSPRPRLQGNPISRITRVIAASPQAVIGVLALVIVAMIWDSVARQAAADRDQSAMDVRRDNTNLASAFAEHTVRTLKGVDQIALLVKHQYEKGGGRLELAEYLRDGTLSSRIFTELGVIDEQGDYHSGSRPDGQRVDRSGSEHFKTHMVGDSKAPHIGRPEQDRNSGKWTLELSRRLNKPDGSFAGAVVMSVDPRYFSGVYSEMDLGRHGVAALVGTDGIVRAGPGGGDLSIGRNIKGSILQAHVSLGDTGSFRAPASNGIVARHMSYRKLADYPLAVAVGQGEEDVLAQSRGRFHQHLVWGAFASAAILAFAILAMALLRSMQAGAARKPEVGHFNP